MSQRAYGTRFTTGCGHSWRRRYWRNRIRRLHTGACTTDCRVCGELLIIPGEQFDGQRLDVVPAEVHMPLFHRYMNNQDSRWPADGSGTGYIEFSVEEEA